jgi:hypothetical protein
MNCYDSYRWYSSSKQEKYQSTDYSTFGHISRLGGFIEWGKKSFELIASETNFHATNPIEDTSINLVYQSQLMIWHESFMEEWDKYFTEKNYPTLKIREFKDCLKPILKVIRDYSHARRQRNTLLAHSFRSDDGRSVLYDKNYGLRSSPKNVSDVIEVSSAIIFIVNCFIANYGNYIAHFESKIAVVEHDDYSLKDPIAKTDEINSRLSTLKNEVRGRLNASGFGNVGEMLGRK